MDKNGLFLKVCNSYV